MLSSTLSTQIETHRGYLIRYVRSQVNDPHAAEDLVQDTLLAALIAAPRFERRSTLRTWLTGILRHKIIDMRRAAGRERSFSELGDGESEEGVQDALQFNALASDWRGEGRDDPGARLARKRFMKALYAGMKLLPPNQRSALEMREIHGHEARDICRTLGVTHSNVCVMIHRAKATLRAGLAEHGGSLYATV